MFLILTLIILVAAFNIISSLIMLVKDKSKDIAILRTMGATQGMVMRIFILTGGLIGVIGTLSGVGLGVLFCENIETIRQGLQSLNRSRTLLGGDLLFEYPAGSDGVDGSDSSDGHGAESLLFSDGVPFLAGFTLGSGRSIAL